MAEAANPSSQDVVMGVPAGAGAGGAAAAPKPPPQIRQPPDVVMDRIEALVMALVEDLSAGKSALPFLAVPTRRGGKARAASADNVLRRSAATAAAPERVVLSDVGGARFARIWAVLSFCYELLAAGRTATQREVYYALTHLFKRQASCNAAILDGAALLGVDRMSLGLFASAKGFVTGALGVRAPGTAEYIDCRTLGSSNGMSISGGLALGQSHALRNFGARAIIVVEKDGIYNRLAEDRLFDSYPCILITGKGFPDVATRALLRRLHDELSLPVYGLCDWNPFGLALLLTYKLGSATGGDEAEQYAVPELSWLGLHAATIDAKALPKECFQTMTATDRSKCSSMLERCEFLAAASDPKYPNLWRAQLQEMARREQKVELEAIFAGKDGLTSFTRDLVTNIMKKEFIG